MPATESQIRDALKTVHDPDLFKDLITLNQVKKIQIVEENVAIEVSTPSPLKDKLRQQIVNAVMQVAGVAEVIVHFAASVSTGQSAPGHAHGAPAARPAPQAPRGLADVKHIITVGAGKGGVGKSTIAMGLAVGLALQGKKVALLDADVYGPSLPTLSGLPHRPPATVGERILPFRLISPSRPEITFPVMSVGFMVDKERAMILRGPMLHGTVKQLLMQVDWTQTIDPENGAPRDPVPVDYLLIDLPPGTGDVSLTLAQTVPLTGAVIVATPQEVALADARRAVRMFQQLGVEILGVVENMSYFVCEHGSAYDIFGRGGAQVMAQQMGLPFLGEVPIDVQLRRNSDEGKPFANFDAAAPSGKPLRTLADMLDKQVAVRLATRPVAKPLNLQIS